LKRRLNPAPLAQCGTGGKCGVELLFRIAPPCAASDCAASHTGDAADGSRGVVPLGREGGREGGRKAGRQSERTLDKKPTVEAKETYYKAREPRTRGLGGGHRVVHSVSALRGVRGIHVTPDHSVFALRAAASVMM
jgi:hypothetical protein